MEDDRTQQTLDALADLFLTGAAGSAAPPDASDADDEQPTEHAVRRPMVDVLADDEDDELSGPAPIRLHPKMADRGSDAPAPRLRLTEAVQGSHVQTELEQEKAVPVEPFIEDQAQAVTADPPVDRADRPAVMVEAVMLGNLPGLAGPWLTQYAQLLAEQTGPVLIMHVEPDQAELELVEPTRGGFAAAVRVRSQSGGKRELVDELESLCQARPDGVRTILLHMTDCDEALIRTRLMGLELWTLLCGSDDAAVVGAYRLVKQLVEADANAATKQVGLMIMGAEGEVAQSAAKKLKATAGAHLHTPVELIGFQKRMVPVNVRQLGRFDGLADQWADVAAWLDSLDWPADANDEADDDASQPAPALALPDAEPPSEGEFERAEHAEPEADEEYEDATDTQPSVVHVTSAEELAALVGAQGAVWETKQTPKAKAPVSDPSPEPVAPEPQPAAPDPEPRAERVEEPEPASTPAPAAQTKTTPPAEPVLPAAEVPTPEPPRATAAPALAESDDDMPSLAELLAATEDGLAGGLALEARCPFQPDTQLVLDQAGVLHLLRRAVAEGDTPDAGVRSALVDLLEARKWVTEHLRLIELTQRQCQFDRDTQPVLHLFTDRADLAVGLVGRLGDTLKLHLLQELQIGDDSAWYCTALS